MVVVPASTVEGLSWPRSGTCSVSAMGWASRPSPLTAGPLWADLMLPPAFCSWLETLGDEDPGLWGWLLASPADFPEAPVQREEQQSIPSLRALDPGAGHFLWPPS